MARKAMIDIPRICLLTNSFYPMIGGGETHALQLCREYLRKGGQIFVVTRRIRADLQKREVVDGLPIYRLPPSGCRRFGKYLMTFPTLAELIKRQKEYDLLYVCGLRIAGIPAMLASRILGKPCVLRAESLGELSGDFIWKSPDERIRRTRMRPLLEWGIQARNHLLLGASAFISISSPIAEEFESMGVPGSKNRRIHNGINMEALQSRTLSRSVLRSRLELPQDAIIFAYSGKLNKGKGLERLLAVWERFSKMYPRAHLVLIGAGGLQYLSCEEALRGFVVQHQLQNSVTFTGFRTNVGEYLCSADFFVFPSENEAFGLSLAEAMACGLPCLASRTGGIPDIVEDGKNGRLVDPYDESAWLQAMTDLIRRPEYARELGRQGQRTILEKFSISTVTDEHLALFRSLVQHHRKSTSA